MSIPYILVLMVKNGDADGMVAGAITLGVFKTSIADNKACSGMKTISSCFIMTLPEGSPYGGRRYDICRSVNIDPDAESLAKSQFQCP